MKKYVDNFYCYNIELRKGYRLRFPSVVSEVGNPVIAVQDIDMGREGETLELLKEYPNEYISIGAMLDKLYETY